ncbi:MAG: putative pseudouridine synthase yhcT [Planctomycetota bacterium]|jgi:23S rRNA pseudouridine1911/1915/1917 synthase
MASHPMVKLLEHLARMHPGASNRTLRQMVEHRRVFVDGVAATRSDLEIGPDAKVTVGKKSLPSEDDGVTVLFEDDHLVVIDKPPGLLTVAPRDDGRTSAWAAVRRRMAPKGADAHLVHRLDEAASGVLVFAKTKEAHDGLKGLFAAHDIERLYIAVVDGDVAEAEGRFDAPLVESLFPPYKVAVLRPGAPRDIAERAESATTLWKRLAIGRRRSAVLVRLETGRKHQIRVHFADHGHPITGDERYGGSTNSRLLLHAAVLGFKHPITGKDVRVTSRPDVNFRRAFSELPDPVPTTW